VARILFMGTPEYARQILSDIWKPDDTFLVVTKPDTPVGRHRMLTPSPVSEWAQDHAIPLDKPERLKSFRQAWEEFQPDWILTAAYGKILPQWVLSLPRFGAYNLHASLLPRWRGANPIAWAIRACDEQTGVTLMKMDEGVDTGPIVDWMAITIGPEDNTGVLTERLAALAGQLWNRTVDKRGLGAFPTYAQPDTGMINAPKFDADEGRLDWNRTAVLLDAWVRSMTPDPGAYTMLDGLRLKIIRAASENGSQSGNPGTARLVGDDWVIATGKGMLKVSLIQPSGRRAMTPGDFVRGRRGERQWILS